MNELFLVLSRGSSEIFFSSLLATARLKQTDLSPENLHII